MARPVSKKEMANTPDALLARDQEWHRLVTKGAFDMKNVKEYSHVAREARRRRKIVHFGLVFSFCVQKNFELKDQPAVFKYRYVF